MKFSFLFSIIAVVMMSTHALAQHSDVEFGYDDTANPTTIDVEVAEVSTEGIGLFEGGFEELDPFTPGDFSADEPGFTTEAAEGLLVNPNDQIFLNVLDAAANSAFGVGYVNYWNPTTGALQASERLSVSSNSGIADLFIDGASIESGVAQRFLGLGDSVGDVHDHVDIDLLDDATAPIGAYGILFELQADFNAADGAIDVTSDPFWIVLNYGLDDVVYEEQALVAFGVVPEPSSLLLLSLAMAPAVLRRRR